MLSESFIAASSSAPKLTTSNSSLIKDAGVFVHSFQPQPALRTTFKKTTSPVNCLAVNETHVFAAQVDKAVVQVYNRSRGNLEATIPFQERIHSITLLNGDTVLALGTEGGLIIFWELATGRQVSTPASHLQAVTVLAVDLPSDFILSGSRDSSVLVWSITDLLSFTSDSNSLQTDRRTPQQTLSAHQSSITSIVAGRSFTPQNIAITASTDKTVIIWEYRTGTQLRTFLLPSAPLCLALDPAERGFYAGFEDGGVQLVNFYPTTSTSGNLLNIRTANHASHPIQPPSSDRWLAPSNDIGSTLSCSLSFDATTLLTGHSSGAIIPWDVASGRPSPPLAQHPSAPITNLLFLPPVGFPNTPHPRLRIPSVVKPRPHEAFSGAKGGTSSDEYTINVEFPSDLALTDANWRDIGPEEEDDMRENGISDFEAALWCEGVPMRMLDQGIAEMEVWEEQSSGRKGGKTGRRVEEKQNEDGVEEEGERDYMPLDERSDEARRLQELEAQVEHLKRVNRVATEQVGKLVKEKKDLETKEQTWQKKEDERYERRKRRADQAWEKGHRGGVVADSEANSLTSADEGDDIKLRGTD